MRVLITGGGGNVGRVLAPALEDAGHEPVLMDNRPSTPRSAGVALDAFNVMAEVPFSTEEFGEWSRKPSGFLEERYPGVAGLVEEQGVDFGELVRMWGFTHWSIEKAKRVLGYRPRYNFPEFFEALRRGDRSHYPYADLLWWGV